VVEQAQASIRAGDTWGVDLGLEKCFDRVNHDGLMSRVRRRVQDRRAVTLLHRVLKAGGRTLEGSGAPTAEGPPPGGSLSPLLANLRLDELDKEWRSEDTGSSAMLTRRTSLCGVGRRGHASGRG
jgi:retron-type reverse transcriptase